MVCQECGLNTAIVSGHSPMCSQYVERPAADSDIDPLTGELDEKVIKIQEFSEAVSEAVVVRGEKSLLGILASMNIHKGDEEYSDLEPLITICLNIGASVTFQVMVEQGILDQEALLRAAGV